MEVGGYRELDLKKGYEYYRGERNVVRLNAGRCGIYYALKLMGLNKILIPYYQCSTVKKFLLQKGVIVNFYHINDLFLPERDNQDADTAFLIVNYFGLIKDDVLKKLVQSNKHVIIDNTQAFFQEPIQNSYSVYSPRKFVGVPDGCYVIGDRAESIKNNYETDLSAGTAGYLLSRIESGGNNNYSKYLQNEERIDQSDVLRMSVLTKQLLDSVDYEFVKTRRKQNYMYADKKFRGLNKVKAEVLNKDESAIPMVYPLIIENSQLRCLLKENNIFVGQWWKYVLEWDEASEWEKYVSRFMLPIQIDQRYGKEEIDYQYDVINLSR